MSVIRARHEGVVTNESYATNQKSTGPAGAPWKGRVRSFFKMLCCTEYSNGKKFLGQSPPILSCTMTVRNFKFSSPHSLRVCVPGDDSKNLKESFVNRNEKRTSICAGLGGLFCSALFCGTKSTFKIQAVSISRFPSSLVSVYCRRFLF